MTIAIDHDDRMGMDRVNREVSSAKCGDSHTEFVRCEPMQGALREHYCVPSCCGVRAACAHVRGCGCGCGCGCVCVGVGVCEGRVRGRVCVSVWVWCVRVRVRTGLLRKGVGVLLRRMHAVAS
jgi:hypothetical protein